MHFTQLSATFLAPGVRAIALFGSHARGDAGRWSDVDLVRFVEEAASPPGVGTHLIDGQLVMVSDVAPQQCEAWYIEPNLACGSIAGLRAAKALHDPNGVFARFQERAHAFIWDTAMQERANTWASAAMVGWIEEAHKGLEGLSRADIGRLLNARHGLSWGLMGVVQIQRGVLIDGDNSVFDQVCGALDPESAALLRASFGIDQLGLEAQVRAGLQLYVRVAALLADTWSEACAPLIAATAAQIEREMQGTSHL